MQINGLILPDSAIEAARAAQQGEFRLADVRKALALVLDQLVDAQQFDFRTQKPAVVADRGADRILQAARRNGEVEFLGAGRWRKLAARA